MRTLSDLLGIDGADARLVNALPYLGAYFVGRKVGRKARASLNRLPRRTIASEAGPYLTRYTLADLPGGRHAYLHFFHRGDHDRQLHSHPWNGLSLILTGGYREERRAGSPGSYRIEERIYRPGSVNLLQPDTFHRVELLDEAAGCWTLFLAGKRSDEWGFWDRDNESFTHWEVFQGPRVAGRAS